MHFDDHAAKGHPRAQLRGNPLAPRLPVGGRLVTEELVVGPDNVVRIEEPVLGAEYEPGHAHAKGQVSSLLEARPLEQVTCRRGLSGLAVRAADEQHVRRLPDGSRDGVRSSWCPARGRGGSR
jgi:hypothetical protein